MTWIPFYPPARWFRAGWRHGFSSSERPKRQRGSRLATIRLVVLLGILAGICVKEGLGLDIVPIVTRFPTLGDGQFTLCSRGNRMQCVVDGDTIYYGGLKIRLEDIDAPETYQHKCDSELALGNRATNRLLELINSGPFGLSIAAAATRTAMGASFALWSVMVARSAKSLLPKVSHGAGMVHGIAGADNADSAAAAR